MPKRRNFGRELWERGIEFARADQNSIAYECHDWTLEKLFFLSNYIAQMTQAMIGNPNFSSINYVDLFAGSGVCAKKFELTKRYPGSSLLAALTEKPFDRLVVAERDQDRYSALVERLKRALGGENSKRMFAIEGDSNSIIDRVIELIPPRSLSLAFVDPYSLDVDFETILKLTNERAVDLLILFADETDLIRNVEKYYYPKLNSKLDRFLGPHSNWRARWDQLENRNVQHLRELFASIYLESLSKIGYSNSATLGIPRGARPMYRLVFASKNPLGLKFWQIAESMELGGDRGLFGPE